MALAPYTVASKGDLRSLTNCPACGSAELTRFWPPKGSTVVAIVTLAVPLAGAFRATRSCLACEALIEVAK